MEELLPPLNARIKALMDAKTGRQDRNVSEFARMISDGGNKRIAQQRLEKIFNSKDPSTVAVDIIEAIITTFDDVDSHWLITGKERSGSPIEPDHHLLTLVNEEVENIKLSLQRLTSGLGLPADPGTNVAGSEGFVKATAGKRASSDMPSGISKRKGISNKS